LGFRAASLTPAQKDSGIDVGQTPVAKPMQGAVGPPFRAWKTFLRNHADRIGRFVDRGRDIAAAA
jgi:hypothetical protein